jgi:hypothetical protein
MDLDFRLDKVIEVFDLVKKMSWGSIPLWFSLTLPVIYIAYVKLLPERTPNSSEAAPTGFRRMVAWFTMPRVDRIVIYTSLILFIIGTITLMVDQNQKEAIRKNGFA